jgi:hypothetical protein
MISALFYGKGGFDHVLFMVNKTLPRSTIRAGGPPNLFPDFSGTGSGWIGTPLF